MLSLTTSKSFRRLMLTLLGIGAAGTAASSAAATTTIFAKQFMDQGVKMDVPSMVYDSKLQLMVDPVTRQTIYSKNKKLKMAKVTAGCSDCPKYDE